MAIKILPLQICSKLLTGEKTPVNYYQNMLDIKWIIVNNVH